MNYLTVILQVAPTLAAFMQKGKAMLGGSPKIDTLVYLACRMLCKQYESRNANIHADAGFVQKVGDLY